MTVNAGSVPQSLRTDRLVLRRWQAEDREPFVALNADPEVMRYFPAPLDRDTSNRLVDAIEASFEERGYGLWAVDAVDDAEGFVGFVGLAAAEFSAPFTPAVEIGWRLAQRVWGRGYAPEAAAAVVADGFGRLGLDEIVSFTAETNLPSRRVMEKLAMTTDPAEDFVHPRVPAGHELARHVLYRRRSTRADR